MTLSSEPSFEFGLAVLESVLVKTNHQRSLTVGIPKEILPNENRIAMTPEGVTTLLYHGHTVLIEKDAGLKANFSNDDYEQVGATIVNTAEEIYKTSTIILKVSLPITSEYSFLQQNQILISGIDSNLLTLEFIDVAQKKKLTCIAFEFIETNDGELPILRTISELTGGLAIELASQYLKTSSGGKGIILGRIAGISPSTIAVIGAGTVGYYATLAAIQSGAQVIVLDKELQKLREFETIFNKNIITSVLSASSLFKIAPIADVMIGAINPKGKQTSPIVSEEIVKMMQPNSVIIDVSINQFRCFETSKRTSHDHPTYRIHNVIHYCVPNITSIVSNTASIGLNNAIIPFVIKLSEQNTTAEALLKSHSLKKGVYIYNSYVTKEPIAARFGFHFRQIQALLSTEFNFS